MKYLIFLVTVSVIASADLMTAKQALDDTKKSLENNYLKKKETCDFALQETNAILKKSASNSHFSEKIYYNFATPDSAYSSSITSACPFEVLEYQILKRGYSVTRTGGSELKISW